MILLWLYSSAALAVDCENAVTTIAINECASQEQKAVEAQLNAAYRRAIQVLEQPDTETERYSDSKRALIAAQRAWIQFREADCTAVFTRHASGTIRTAMFLGCLQHHAEQRIKDLEEYAHD